MENISTIKMIRFLCKLKKFGCGSLFVDIKRRQFHLDRQRKNTEKTVWQLKICPVEKASADR